MRLLARIYPAIPAVLLIVVASTTPVMAGDESTELAPLQPLELIPTQPGAASGTSSSSVFTLMENPESAGSAQTYQAIRQMKTEAEARKALEVEIQKQGEEFTRHFVKLDIYGSDFPREFGQLIAQYPLAPLDDFAAKLTHRAYRVLRAGHHIDAHEESFEKAGDLLRERIRELTQSPDTSSQLAEAENLNSLRTALEAVQLGQATDKSE